MNRQQFNNLLERKAYNNQGEATTVGKLPWNYLGLYFTASWCGACQSFGKQFSRFYRDINAAKKELEVVAVSLDTSREDYLEQVTKYPWWALPFDEQYNNTMMHLYQVQYIPQMIVMDRQGNTVSRNGIADVRKHTFSVLDYWKSLLNK